ncbi:hypothetical protein STCU_11707 [Strigomonas culicis]|uniref:Uncharacterized protein n=1 Tax=Strigomonas culicis TaxID=28005 RepID=S9UZ77_9TRYP|nr:hypothetical protein STCU_11707 [Strigomonas culicis]|eukprot:EPY15865.1 hypothetical protein STCU_11707 [Strigomonas culicis]
MATILVLGSATPTSISARVRCCKPPITTQLGAVCDCGARSGAASARAQQAQETRSIARHVPCAAAGDAPLPSNVSPAMSIHPILAVSKKQYIYIQG